MPIVNRDYYGAGQRGVQDAYNQQFAQQRNALGALDLEQAKRVNALAQNPNATAADYARTGRTDVAYYMHGRDSAAAEQRKVDAQRLFYAAQYGVKSQSPKAFIAQNFPEIAAMNPQFQQESDEQIRAGLQDLIGRFGAQAGIGPEQQRGAGPLYKVVDPETGAVTYATAQDAAGGTPYVYTPPARQPAGEKRPTPPRGYRYKDDGSVEPIPGGPNDPNAPNRPTAQAKPPTEGDKRARVMYFSMRNAEGQLEKITSADTSNLGQAILGKVSPGRVLQSDEYKRYEAAGLRWAANLLYLKSGATATPDEIRSTWLQFFPQPGDGSSVKAQKDEARQQEMFAINDTYAFEKGQQPAAPQGAQQGLPVRIKSESEYAALKSGTKYIAPDGTTRTKR